jgi:hypothetical protein
MALNILVDPKQERFILKHFENTKSGSFGESCKIKNKENTKTSINNDVKIDSD